MKKYEEEIPKFCQESLKRTVLSSKKAFYKNQQQQVADIWEFLYTQFGIIPKRVWAIQISILISFCFFLYYVDFITTDIDGYFTVWVSMLVILAIPEICKNIRYKAVEVEGSAFYNLQKVYAARMLLIGMGDLILATVMIGMTAHVTGTALYQCIIYFLVPFNSTCCVCFTTVAGKKKIGSQIHAASMGSIWAFTWYEISRFRDIYEKVQSGVWVFLILLSVVYLVYVVRKMLINTKFYCEVSDFLS